MKSAGTALLVLVGVSLLAGEPVEWVASKDALAHLGAEGKDIAYD